MLLRGESYHFTPRKGNFQDVKAIVLRRKSYAFTAFLENFTFSRAVHFTVFRPRLRFRFRLRLTPLDCLA